MNAKSLLVVKGNRALQSELKVLFWPHLKPQAYCLVSMTLYYRWDYLKPHFFVCMMSFWWL